MKKGLKILAIMIAAFMSVTYVKADVIQDITIVNYNNEMELLRSNLPYICTRGQVCTLQETYDELITYYQTNLQENYQYYAIEIQKAPAENYMTMTLYFTNSDEFTYENIETNNTVYHWVKYFNGYTGFSGNEIITQGGENTIFPIMGGIQDSGGLNSMYEYYDSNIDFMASGNYEIRNFYSGSNLIIENNKSYPKIKDLMQYNSWSEYENNHLEGYTEVDLDNYEYVLLSLKNYNQNQAFQTNLQVKGQIGITPIYNFGQTSKDAITGVQVQDRCNINYESYTSYPFYIIQSDLQNNTIYAVKECSQGSSFKFDNTIFDITYITQENKDNPTVTINGNTYDVIPYEDLPSTATKNEENNYIPGESGSASDTGGLDSAIKDVQQRMSEIWNTFTYFTDFVGQLFSSLPAEIQTILISAFTVGIVIGLIKLFVN